MNVAERNLLVENYLPLAKSLAYKKSKTSPNGISLDELRSAAYFGLVVASRHYDPKKLSAFGPYARFRIWGELSDCVRSYCKNKVKYIDLADDSFPIEEDNFKLQSMDFFNKLTKSLNEVAKDVVFKYYIEGKTLKSIASNKGLSIGRVSQILNKTLDSLRSILDEEEIRQELAA